MKKWNVNQVANRTRSSRCAGTLGWALLMIVAATLRADTYTWDGAVTAGPHSWDSAGNWGGVDYPHVAGDTANLTANWSPAPTVNLNTTTTLGTLNLDDTGASGDVSILVAPNGGRLLMDNFGAEVAINSSGAANTISAPIGLATTLNVTTTSDLTLSGYLYATQVPAGLKKNGANKLTLSNPTNALSGTVTMNAGTLTLALGSSTAAKPIGTNAITLAGGTISIENNAASSSQYAWGNDVAVTGDGQITFRRISGTANNNGMTLGSLSIGSQTLTLNPLNDYDFFFSGPVTLTGTPTFAVNGTGTEEVRFNAGVTDNGGGLGFRKSGAGLLILPVAGSFSGPVTVAAGTLRASAIGALGTYPAITVGDASGSANAALNIGAAGLTITQAVTVASGSSGTATLSSANTSGTATYSGDVTLNKNVSLDAGNNAAGTLVLSGTLDDGADTFGVTKGGNASTVRLTGPAIWYDGPTVLSGGTYEIATTNNWTPAGVISGAGALTKSIGTSTLNYTLAHTYSGATTLNAGALVIAGSSGSAANSAFTVQQSGIDYGPASLVLNGQSGVPATRTKGVTISGNAETVVLGGAGANTTDIQNGNLTAGSGLGTLTVHPDASYQSAVQFANLGTRANGGTLLLRGTNLGATPAAGVGSIFFTTTPSGANFVGGGGTGPLASIIPYAMVDATTNGLGSALATYDATRGVRALDVTTETTNLVDATSAMNVLVSSGGTAAGKSVNAMLFNNVSGSPYTLTLDTAHLNPLSGTFLFTGTSDITFARASTYTTRLTNTLANVLVGGTGTATINTPFVFTTGGALVKSGPGTLVLGSAITISGTTAAAPIYINQGVLKQGAASVGGGARPTSGNTTTLFVRQGGVLDLGGYALNMPNNTTANVAFGGIIRNSGANANIASGSYGGISTINGLVLDGTPEDGATSGLVSFTQANQQAYWIFSHGGHAFNNLTQSDNSVYNNLMTLYSLTPTDSNTVYGTVAVSTGRMRLYTTADAGSSEVAKTIGSAPVTIGNANSDFQVWSRGATTPLTAANTLVWPNNVTVNANGAITIGRWDSESANVTQQFGNLSIGAYTLKVTANNGYTLAFGGTQTLTGNAGFNVVSGTLKLNAVGQTGLNRTLTKSGAGTLELSGTQTYTGMTTVSAGTLTGDYTLAGGLTTSGGATLSPGGSADAAMIELGALNMTNSTYVVTLNGPNPGQYDQLKVATTYGGDGSVVLRSDSALQVLLGYTPAKGTRFVIVDNDGTDAVVGTFTGLPEGTVFSVTTGAFTTDLRIRYSGGDGNDIELKTPDDPGTVVIIR